MLFNSVEFIVFFLPTVWLVFFVLGSRNATRAAMSWLVLASFFYYGWWNPKYLVLILISILFNFGVGRILDRKRNALSRPVLAFGVIANVAALGYFKYANFFVDNFNAIAHSSFQLEPIVLPLAISFFTFQQIAYLVDTYQGTVTDCTFLQYCLFVTYFPQLIAGPIVHHKEVLPQFAEPSIFKLNSLNVGEGLAFFLIGLFKKTVMADGLSSYVAPVFLAADQGTDISFFVGWAGALAYTFQLYFDFSGYSDMAIGIGLLFNIKLPYNFHSPYKAANIIDFWRRWHITLSRFLRDYLYIPLGGSRKGKSMRYVNLMLTMIIGGLWHGASWTFVVWGTMHGIYLVINHAWRKLRESLGFDLSKTTWLGLTAGRTITFLAVIVGWVLFRATTFSGAINILKGMVGLQGFVLPTQLVDLMPSSIASFFQATGTMPLLAGGTIVGIFEMSGMIGLSLILICLPASQEMSNRLRLIALVLCMYFTIQAVFFSRAPSEFLYFQF